MKNREYGIAINCYYICICLLIIFVLAMCVLHLPNMRDIDTGIIRFVQINLSVFPLTIAKFVSSFGCADYWLWPRITAASVMVSHKYYLRAFLFFILTRAIFLFNDGILKHLICRERPCGPIIGGYSFPSGHAAFTMCTFGILIYLVNKYVRTDWWRILLITLFTVWIILTGISRMWLNVHFLSDIVAGYCSGLVFVNIFIMFDKLYSK